MSALTKKNLINFDENGRNTSIIRPGEADLASPGPVRIKLGHLNANYLCWSDSHFLIGQPLDNLEATLGQPHCKCLQGFTGALRGNWSAGISELQGLHVYLHSA